jgi:pyrroline-5-carboxylate reductase
MAAIRYGFIGAGRMATALARGFVAAELARSDDLLASDPAPDAAAHFQQSTKARIARDNAEVASQSDVVFLAVKPQQMASVLGGLRGQPTRGKLVISVAAGISLTTLAQDLGATGSGDGPRLVRVMPNTPCLVGQGASVYCLGPGATAADGDLVGKLLSSVGRAFEAPETQLDAVTGLSGSGPAFVFLMIEALSDGGVKMGLPRGMATALAAQTVRGAAELLLTGGEHPAALKDQVASPGGTTIAGLHVLEAAGVRGALMAAVEAATLRSIELGRVTT